MWAQSSHTFSDVSLRLPGPLADSPRFVAGDHTPGDQHPSAGQSPPLSPSIMLWLASGFSLLALPLAIA